jgi:cytochrome c-type protein NapC
MSASDKTISALLSRLRNKLSERYLRFPILIFFGLFFLGIFSWGGFNWAMELSNTESFCISCHEMENNVYQEYRSTIHYSNRTGVRATCPDCHVPKEWHHMVVRKIVATNELFQKAIGTIDTREKFLSRRSYLAEKVWHDMRNSQSRECRNCHNFVYMDIEKQQSVAGQIHASASTQGLSCIDCHMGIAHELPEELISKEHLRFEKEKWPCGNCHVEMTASSIAEEWDWDD